MKLTKQEVSILHKAHKKSVTVICDECNGTGQVAYGRSGSESDGNALETEPCPECGYAEKVKQSIGDLMKDTK